METEEIKLNEIEIYRCDGWAILIVNKALISEDHNIGIRDISQYVPIGKIKEEWVSDGLQDYIDEHFQFPDTYEEIKELQKIWRTE